MSTPPAGPGDSPRPGDLLSPLDDTLTDPHAAGTVAAHPWPPSSEWPADDATALEHARFYRDSLGLDVYPTPSDWDVKSLANYAFAKAVDAWRGDHGEDMPDEETRAFLWDLAREEAEDSRRGPIGWSVTRRAKAELSAKDFDAMWTDVTTKAPGSPLAHASQRGICVMLGRSTRGWSLAQVDVDVKHGADLAGEWACLPGPADRSPSGGLHVYVLDPRVGDRRVRTSSNALAPGVEVRTSGFAVWPAGQGGDQARRWLRRDALRAAPPALCRPPPRRQRTGSKPTMDDGAYDDGHVLTDRSHEPRSHGQSSRAAETLGGSVDAGERNEKVLAVVGILARPHALPPDVVDAVLLCLVDARAVGASTAEETRAEVTTWRAALTRGPRDAEFAAEVVEAWLLARYQGPKPWLRGAIGRIVRSLWKTAERRQAERDGTSAGAEDFAVGDPVWCEDRDAAPRPAVLTPASMAASPPTDRVPGTDADSPAAAHAHAAAGLGPLLAAAYPFAPPTAASTVRGRDDEPVVDYAKLFRPSAVAFSEADQNAFQERRRASFARGPAFYDFARGAGVMGLGDESYPFGYGLGPWLAKAVRGLSQGSVISIGAAGGKKGKTVMAGQMVEGLQMATARRLLGEPAWADAPVVLVFWVCEMPEDGEIPRRLLARHYGLQQDALSQGHDAAEYVRSVNGWPAAEVVNRSRMLASLHHREAFSRARWSLHGGGHDWTEAAHHAAHRLVAYELNHEIDLRELPEPRGQGRGRVVHDAGPMLVRHVAKAVRLRVAAFVDVWGAEGHFTAADVLPIVVTDPVQRWSEDSDKGSLDALIHGHVRRLSYSERNGGVGAAVIFTSDTTKAAVREVSLARFYHEDGQVIAGEIFAGSQGIVHGSDCLGLHAETSADGLAALLRARHLVARSGGAGPTVYPFTLDLATGRLRPLDPATVPAPLKPTPGSAGGGGGRDGGDRWSRDREAQRGGGRGERPPPIGVPAAGRHWGDRPGDD